MVYASKDSLEGLKDHELAHAARVLRDESLRVSESAKSLQKRNRLSSAAIGMVQADQLARVSAALDEEFERRLRDGE